MEIKTFGVIGSGQMGGGIAQVAAASGLSVIMNDISEQFVAGGIKTITKNLNRQVEKGALKEADSKLILGRIKPSTSLKDMAGADFIVEAASERKISSLPSSVSSMPCARPMPSCPATPHPSPSAGLHPRPRGRKRSSACTS